MKMNKILAVLLSLALLPASFGPVHTTAGETKINEITTIFLLYDRVHQIVGDSGRADITMLLDIGMDLHCCQSTVADTVFSCLPLSEQPVLRRMVRSPGESNKKLHR